MAAPSHAATVTVVIGGVRNNHGHVRAALCPRAAFLQLHCPWTGIGVAQLGEVRVTILNVPPGTYAAEAFHDENDTGILAKSFFGLPREGIGFSNNAPMHFGPPRFDAASFVVETVEKTVRFRLRYYD